DRRERFEPIAGMTHVAAEIGKITLEELAIRGDVVDDEHYRPAGCGEPAGHRPPPPPTPGGAPKPPAARRPRPAPATRPHRRRGGGGAPAPPPPPPPQRGGDTKRQAHVQPCSIPP